MHKESKCILKFLKSSVRREVGVSSGKSQSPGTDLRFATRLRCLSGGHRRLPRTVGAGTTESRPTQRRRALTWHDLDVGRVHLSERLWAFPEEPTPGETNTGKNIVFQCVPRICVVQVYPSSSTSPLVDQKEQLLDVFRPRVST